MPDEAHAEYYKNHPNGNHDVPSAITAKFMEEQQQTNKDLVNNIIDLRTGNATIIQKLDNFAETLNRVEIQTSKTNGRVSTLETWKNENAEFIKDLRAERRQMVMKMIDLLVKIVIGLILVKVGWADLIK